MFFFHCIDAKNKRRVDLWDSLTDEMNNYNSQIADSESEEEFLGCVYW